MVQKNFRIETIHNAFNYDILITTYSLLRNDINDYANIKFNTIILDEAQNVKNYNSQNSIADKSLKAKNKFALTGTPIENSLLELWSIFDFIMPAFIVKYYRKYLGCIKGTSF